MDRGGRQAGEELQIPTERITVFGSSRAAHDDEAYGEGLRLGRLLAEAGYAVCTGGYGGAMEAVSRGAAEAGGSAIGVTVDLWTGRHRANRWVTEEVRTPHLFERLACMIASDGYVALTGGPGTLGEVALTWNLFQTESIPRRPLVLVGRSWRAVIGCLAGAMRIEPEDLALLQFAETVDGVVPLLRGGGAAPPG